MKASELMQTNVISVKKDTTVEEIAHLLAEKNISGVPVLSEEGHILGVVSQKDILYKDIEPHLPPMVELLGGIIYPKGVKHFNEELKKILATKAVDIMNEKVTTVSKDTEIHKIVDIMVEKDVCRVLVTENKICVGIISMADIVRYIANNL